MLTKEEEDILTNKIIEYLECGKKLSDILLNTPEGRKLYAETYAEQAIGGLAKAKPIDIDSSKIYWSNDFKAPTLELWRVKLFDGEEFLCKEYIPNYINDGEFRLILADNSGVVDVLEEEIESIERIN